MARACASGGLVALRGCSDVPFSGPRCRLGREHPVFETVGDLGSDLGGDRRSAAGRARRCGPARCDCPSRRIVLASANSSPRDLPGSRCVGCGTREGVRTSSRSGAIRAGAARVSQGRTAGRGSLASRIQRSRLGIPASGPGFRYCRNGASNTRRGFVPCVHPSAFETDGVAAPRRRAAACSQEVYVVLGMSCGRYCG